MKTVFMLSHLRFRKLELKHIKILGLAFTLLLIFSPVVQAQYLLANWDFTNNVGETYDIASSISHPGFSAYIGTNNPAYTCYFWNGVENDQVYRIRNAGVGLYDPPNPQGYIYIKVESNRPWRLDEIRAEISENANGAGNDIPVDVNVEYSTEADFDPYVVLGTETVNGSKSCVFNGPISFPPGIRYIRFRSTSDMWCSPYLGVDDVQILGLQHLEVAIDIKPGSDPNCFNINGHGVIPVAILGSADFDVQDIDPDSLLFGGLAVRVRGNKGPLCHVEYINNDSFPDLVCQFEDDASNWSAGVSTATLTGDLFEGTAIEGTDSICVVPPE